MYVMTLVISVSDYKAWSYCQGYRCASWHCWFLFRISKREVPYFCFRRLPRLQMYVITLLISVSDFKTWRSLFLFQATTKATNARRPTARAASWSCRAATGNSTVSTPSSTRRWRHPTWSAEISEWWRCPLAQGASFSTWWTGSVWTPSAKVCLSESSSCLPYHEAFTSRKIGMGRYCKMIKLVII